MLHQTVIKNALKALRDEAESKPKSWPQATIDGHVVVAVTGGAWYQNGELVGFKELCFDLGLSAADFTEN